MIVIPPSTGFPLGEIQMAGSGAARPGSGCRGSCRGLSTTSNQVRNSPGFDKDSWPSMVDLQWASSVHQHYGREPYWEENVSRTGAIAPSDLGAPEAGGVKL